MERNEIEFRKALLKELREINEHLKDIVTILDKMYGG